MGRLLMGVGILAVGGCGALRSSYFVDSVDEGRAVLITDQGEAMSVELDELPTGAREGDWIVDGRIDEEVRARRQERIEAKRRALLGHDDGADFALDILEPHPGKRR